ncbi:hypothetical protein PG994_008296 [Apiospora phragmitis]|uniref:Uncharacterized protein n=1 Tax=Apiospora phragmitis TaxID=2905665 RepID=A0ABR1USM3_9PEZI
MIVLDIIKLELHSNVDVTTTTTAAGRLWQATLEYILDQVSVIAATSEPLVFWGQSQGSSGVLFLFIYTCLTLLTKKDLSEVVLGSPHWPPGGSEQGRPTKAAQGARQFREMLWRLARQMDVYIIRFPVEVNEVTNDSLELAFKRLKAAESGIAAVRWGWLDSLSEGSSRTLLVIINRPSSRKLDWKSLEDSISGWLRSDYDGVRPEPIEVLSVNCLRDDPTFSDGCLTEVIRFSLPKGHTSQDRFLLEYYVNRFISITYDPYGGHFGDYDPLEAFGPLWMDSNVRQIKEDHPREQRYCVLLLQWAKPEDRGLWLERFMGQSYSVLGHKSHLIGCNCPDIKAWSVVLTSVPTGTSPSEDESHEDLGF